MPDISFAPEQYTVPLDRLAPGAVQVLQRPAMSRSQRKIQEDIATIRAELTASGRLRPATIINFNPVPLVLDGLIRTTVPASGYDNTSGRVEVPYNGQMYVGHCVTIRTPLIYASTVGSEEDTQSLVDMPTLAANYILPIGIAYSFLEHYSLEARDSAHMGGVLIFEGDRHTLSEDHLRRSEGVIQVPSPVALPRNRRTFTTVSMDLESVLDAMFSKQAQYADSRIQNAHALDSTNDPMQQKQITDVDRMWARWALSHGLIEELPPWVSKRIVSGAALREQVRCPVCQKPRVLETAFLCPDDRAPYNAFEAFMAGMPVPQQYIDMLSEEQFTQVAKETVRREERHKAAMAKARREAKAERKNGTEAEESDE